LDFYGVSKIILLKIVAFGMEKLQFVQFYGVVWLKILKKIKAKESFLGGHKNLCTRISSLLV
jgi:hypothetical protein